MYFEEKIPTLNSGLNRIIVIPKNLESSAEAMHPIQLKLSKTNLGIDSGKYSVKSKKQNP